MKTHKSVKSSIQTTFDDKIRICFKFRVVIDQLVLKRINFEGFYSSPRSYLFEYITRTTKEKQIKWRLLKVSFYSHLVAIVGHSTFRLVVPLFLRRKKTNIYVQKSSFQVKKQPRWQDTFALENMRLNNFVGGKLRASKIVLF